jgi:hypothetical protein
MLFNYLAEIYMQFATGNTQTKRKFSKGTILEVKHLKHLEGDESHLESLIN